MKQCCGEVLRRSVAVEVLLRSVGEECCREVML